MLYFFRTPFPKSISRGLLLKNGVSVVMFRDYFLNCGSRNFNTSLVSINTSEKSDINVLSFVILKMLLFYNLWWKFEIYPWINAIITKLSILKKKNRLLHLSFFQIFWPQITKHIFYWTPFCGSLGKRTDVLIPKNLFSLASAVCRLSFKFPFYLF